jgi:two-component system, OmpR family, response regulator
VLMLSGRGEVTDRVHGLESGADDYLVKPFSLAELRARLRALARRPPLNGSPPVLRVGDLWLDPVSHAVSRGGRPIALTKTEFALLETLMRSPGRVHTRRALIDRVWDGRDDHRSNVIEVYVSYLRAKVDRPFGRRSIKTVHGVGYTVLAD